DVLADTAVVHNVAVSKKNEKLWFNTENGQLVYESDVPTDSRNRPRTDTTFTKTDNSRYVQTGYVFDRKETKLNFRGIKAMGRFSINIGSMMGLDETIGPNNFKIFAEAALLGVQNQPFYYEKISDRIAYMFGIHIPTWGILDKLSFQAEYFGNPYKDSWFNYRWVGRPVPTYNGNTKLAYENDPTDFHEDDWKWSLYAKKAVVPGLNLFLQVASDHMRTINSSAFNSYEPVFQKPSQWYYLIRAEFGF
ncbi:MAG: hypothetical protein HQK83_18245, partial [Fibrobacteria bacterium]|nr:hypothetical protein [Fibrobacteria bacterium]